METFNVNESLEVSGNFNQSVIANLQSMINITRRLVFPLAATIATACNVLIVATVIDTRVDRVLKLRLILVAVLDVVQAVGLIGLLFGDFSQLSCRLSWWIGSALMVAAYNEHFLLVVDRFTALRNFSWYRDHVMYKLRQPFVTTVINCVISLLAYSPLWLTTVFNSGDGVCEKDVAFLKHFQFLYPAYFSLFSVVPMLVVLCLNLYILIKMRRMAAELHGMGHLSSEEWEKEKSMTTGSIICSISYFIFSAARFVVIAAASEVQTGELETGLDSEAKFMLVRLLNNIAVVLVSLNMSVAFFFFLIQNQQFRLILNNFFRKVKKKLFATFCQNKNNNDDGRGEKQQQDPNQDRMQLADVAINRMPDKNENLALKQLQIQLRKEIQLQYGQRYQFGNGLEKTNKTVPEIEVEAKSPIDGGSNPVEKQYFIE